MTQMGAKLSFAEAFEKLTGRTPFPWQEALFQQLRLGGDAIPSRCDIPTGLGKTSVIAVWLLARQENPLLPRRLVYVVNRRTVVDQTTEEVEKIRNNLPEIGRDRESLAISTLRGQFADNREWSADPSREAVICGTVDMIGSRLLFDGYGLSYRAKPLHAGFLGQDALIVHDESHLEPAFQDLLVAIEKEQRSGRYKDRFPLRVMALSATTRSGENGDSEKVFMISDADRTHPEVARRLHAVKRLHLIPQTEPKAGGQLAKLALEKFKDSGAAVLIFARTIEDVQAILAALDKAGVKKDQKEQLIGPMRGRERNRLADSEVFRRFLPGAASNEKTVFLVCTSAGEVGVNLSADHLVCDLTTLESMAQRFGRVNRFGLRDDSEIYVIHPTRFDDKAPEPQRERTLELLKRLDGDASLEALARLSEEERGHAFSPPPKICPTSDMLFDAWALTSLRGELPGRPKIEPYLHGVREFEPPETRVAWREEVRIITGDLAIDYPPEDLLEEYPLKPHELLTDRTDRVHKELVKLAQRHPDSPIWVIDDFGEVAVSTLDQLSDKSGREAIAGKTILLPHDIGGLTAEGLLDGAAPAPEKGSNDVADEPATTEEPQTRIRLKIPTSRLKEPRGDNDELKEKTRGMRLILRIDLSVDEEASDEAEPKEPQSWLWFERSAPTENSKSASDPVLLDNHVKDVVQRLDAILSRLTLDPVPEVDAKLKRAVRLAAEWHDSGKRRELWQRSIGRPNELSDHWYAKSGRFWRVREVARYRHEFGSLVDVQGHKEFQSLDDDSKDLALHLIAAHHGMARPHFTLEQAIDPEASSVICEAIANEAPRRFARLQRKYGRWGLAYLESLLRAADWAASANPSVVEKEGE